MEFHFYAYLSLSRCDKIRIASENIENNHVNSRYDKNVGRQTDSAAPGKHYTRY